MGFSWNDTEGITAYQNATGDVYNGNDIHWRERYDKWYNEVYQGNASDLVSGGSYINQDNWLKELTDLAKKGDAAALDRLFNYYSTLSNQQTARDWTAMREDTQFQRLIEDLKKAGISPYIISGATPAASPANYTTFSGSQFSTQESSKRSAETAAKERANDITTTILRIIGTAIGALIMFG